MKMYSLKDINSKYGISIPMLKKMVANRMITVVKIGTKNFIKESDIEQYIDANTREANV